MPGLVRGMARTAAIVGTATATRECGGSTRQANKNAAAYSQAMAQAAPPPQEYSAPPAQPAPAPSSIRGRRDFSTGTSWRGHVQGILTDQEFAEQKAKLLGS